MLAAAMRLRAFVGMVSLSAVLGCTGGDERSSLATGALSDAADAPARLWQVTLDGAPAADTWLDAGPAERTQRTRSRLAQLEREHARLRTSIGASATIVGELSRLANGFLVLAPEESAERIRGLEGVAQVALAPLYRPSLASVVPVVGAPAAWTGVNGVHGEGVRLGIIDSGIDYVHADFGGSGSNEEYAANDRAVVEPGSFPTDRVTGGWDFAGDAYDATDPAKNKPAPDADPLDCNQGNGGEFAGGHGTHVAGIAAGNGVTSDGKAYNGTYDATLSLAAFGVAPGVAPKASLYALRVFGCGGSTGLVPLALERAADPNEDGSFEDRLDVVNLSLGSSYGLGAGLEVGAVQKLFKLGTVVVAAAGNDGDTTFDNGAPGTLREVLTVAASEDRPWLPLHIDSPASVAGTYPAAEGPISTPFAGVGEISGALIKGSPSNGCSPFSNVSSLAGGIALIDRGSCPFVTKLSNARAAGALAAIVVDDQESSEPFVMGGESVVDLPAVLIRKNDGKLLESALNEGVTARLLGGERYEGPGAEPIAGFSSRGPSPVDLTLKPDVTAPGTDIRSAAVGTGTGGVVMQGTSMACPMTAGAVALVRQAHPALTPTQVKALVMNTAETLVGSNGATFALSRQGNGRIALEDIAQRVTTARVDGNTGDVALSFGALVVASTSSATRTAVIENHGTEPRTFSLTTTRLDALAGVSVSVDPPSLTVEPGTSASVAVTLTIDPRLLGTPGTDPLTASTQFDYPRHHLNEAFGHLTLVSPEETLRLPYYAVVRAAEARVADAAVACEPNQRSGDFLVPLEGSSAHPKPVVTAFELGAEDEENPKSKGDAALAAVDVRAVGIASDYSTKGAISDTTLYFAIAVSGPFTTPALGPFQPLGVLISNDQDAAAEWKLGAAPFAGERPYGDVLVTVVTNAKGERVGERRFVNMVPAGDTDTAPFVNQVLVLPVFARDLGLTEEKTTLRFAAFADRLETGIYDDMSAWVDYDVTKPKLDTSLLAPTAGRPLFLGDDALRLRVNGEFVGDGPMPSALLLHHNGEPGHPWDVVSLGAAETEGLTLTLDTRPSASSPIVRKITLSNLGARAIDGVNLTGTFSSGLLRLAAPSQGSCVQSTLSCSLGRIEPGKAATVTLELEAEDDVVAELQATTSNGCVAKTTRTLLRSDAEPALRLATAGGCSCAVRGGNEKKPYGLIAAVVLVATVAQRRRRR